MDIAALSITKNQVQLQQDIGVAVIKKVMNAAEENGNLITQMLMKSENSMPQTKLDLYV
ncbi:YjfB family protein [Desulforamulus aeronauticus]|uniref:Putative motility protein n=1 Tax=Desulforamulus aeronauticus DSM 10349 TaxID=1121421 RepID=A0A1M6RDM0_9FIRM|nr:YjfB family protein [Desulforamulus aeronauticus]SHK30490.1 Putative motility protein [Desulforamulus aeronauticus DSM 10349]